MASAEDMFEQLTEDEVLNWMAVIAYQDEDAAGEHAVEAGLDPDEIYSFTGMVIDYSINRAKRQLGI